MNCSFIHEFEHKKGSRLIGKCVEYKDVDNVDNNKYIILFVIRQII